VTRTTGLQVAHAGLLAALERWRDQLTPREYAVLIELFLRYLEAERKRTELAHRRWAA
jgi:hypothetical protein